MRSGAMTAVLLALVVDTSSASAQTKRPDDLYVTGQAAFVGDTETRGAGVEWLHPANERVALDVGGFMGTGVGSWFSYGRIGANARYRTLTITGALDLGGGKEGATKFSYTRVRSEVSAPVRSPRLMLHGEVDHMRMARTVVTGLRGGSTWQWTPRLSTRVNGHTYSSAGSFALAGSVRADYGVERWRVFGGAFVSRKPVVPDGPVELGSALQATRSGFAGVQVRAGAQDLVSVIDVSSRSRGQVATLLLSLRVPIQ